MPQSKPKPCLLQRPNPAIVGDWPLDEGGGLILYDHSGLGNNAQFAGGLPLTGPPWTFGIHGDCILTDGVSVYVTAPNPLASTIVGGITIWAWAYAPNASNYGLLYDWRRSSDGQGFVLYQDKTSGKAILYVPNGASGNFTITGGTSIYGGWHFLSATISGANAILYVDGVQDAVTTNVGTFPPNTSATVLVNKTYDGAFGNAYVDCFGVMNRALTFNEMQSLYADSYARFRRRWHFTSIAAVPQSPKTGRGSHPPGLPWFPIAAPTLLPNNPVPPPTPPPPPASPTQPKAPGVPMAATSPGTPWYPLGPARFIGIPTAPAGAPSPTMPPISSPASPSAVQPGTPWFPLGAPSVPRPPQSGVPPKPKPTGASAANLPMLHRMPSVDRGDFDQRMHRFSELLSIVWNSFFGQGYWRQTGPASFVNIGGAIVANRRPTANDDASQRIQPGMMWLDPSDFSVYMNLSNGIGAAVWLLFSTTIFSGGGSGSRHIIWSNGRVFGTDTGQEIIHNP